MVPRKIRRYKPERIRPIAQRVSMSDVGSRHLTDLTSWVGCRSKASSKA